MNNKIFNLFFKSRLVNAVRQAFMLLTPIIVISSVAIALLYFPVQAYQNLLSRPSFYIIVRILQLMVTCGMDYISIVAVFLISFFYDKKAGVANRMLLAILNVSSFLMLIGCGTDSFMPELLGTNGFLFVFFVCTVNCHLFVLLHAKIDGICRRFGADSARNQYSWLVLTSVDVFVFVSIFFLFLGVSAFLNFVLLGGMSLFTVINNAVMHFVQQTTRHELVRALVIRFLSQLLFFVGLNGDAVLEPLVSGYYEECRRQVGMAIQQGLEPSYLITDGFGNTFVSTGGSGCLLALLIAILLVSHNKQSRDIARMSIFPALFNVGELLTYGLPIVFNPALFIPFLLVPLLNTVICYGATAAGFLPVITNNTVWTSPVLVGGYTAAGGMSGAVMQLILLAVDSVVYLPFVMLNDWQEELIFSDTASGLVSFIRQNEVINEQVDFKLLPDLYLLTARSLMDDLKDDLSSGNLFMFYQPQFDSSNHVVGAEALIRWMHPKIGNIYSPLIIQLAQAGGFLFELERFIFTEVCRAIKTVEARTDRRLEISANITGISMLADGFEAMIRQSVQSTGIDPSLLGIEITEQEAVANTENLYHLKEYGHKLFIDDFGMGYTSIKYLESNLFDVVKLDGSLTKSIMDKPRTREIVSSVTTLCKNLHMQVVAEYVETEEQRDALQAMGCDIYQGYLYSKPLSQIELLLFLYSVRE